MKTFKATKDGVTLKYLIASGMTSTRTMEHIKMAIKFLEKEEIAESVVTLEGWKVQRDF